jgi:hypothetical protein
MGNAGQFRPLNGSRSRRLRGDGGRANDGQRRRQQTEKALTKPLERTGHENRSFQPAPPLGPPLAAIRKEGAHSDTEKVYHAKWKADRAGARANLIDGGVRQS